MNIRFLTAAREELGEAFVWYERQVPGLGFAFLDETDEAVRRIHAYPESFAEIGRGIRRARLNRFPYGLIYSLEGDGALIVAVAHLHRRPWYWKERRPQD